MRGTPSVFAALTSRTGMRRVLAAYAVYDFIEFYAWLTIILWAFDRGGAGLAGVAAVVQLVPAALLGPALAGIGDRLPRGTALALAHGLVAVLSAVTWAALAADASTAVVIGASTLLTTAIAVVRPIHFAALPQLASAPAQLVSANSLSSVLDGSTRFIGPVVAGVLVAGSGPTTAMAVAVAVAILPPLLCLRLGLSAPAAADDEESGLRGALGGLISLWRDWASLALLLVLAIDFVVTGALDILGVAYAKDVLDLAEDGAGLLIGSLGIGGLLGAFVGAWLSHGRRLARVVVWGAVLEGVAFALVPVWGLLVPAAVTLALTGLGGAATVVAGRTLLQRSTDDRILARVFAVQESTALLGSALGALLAPLLIDRFGAGQAWVPLGVGVALVAVACTIPVRRLEKRARYLPAELDLLRQVEFLAELPPYDVERLARNSRWVELEAGVVVLRQGDLGREFFVIGAGEVSITVDGVRKSGLLGPGDYFGEVALLRHTTRTATVTAESPLRVLVLRGADFLAAVTGGVDGSSITAEIGSRYDDQAA
ncbi:cyclic nucleotide-binding domain-containing protein [Longivirga aurantiaca]|uniref:Cyclic nucleotide-binding domain-containing protein n=1 Tax=Longivirga aurantiaca TaxID=1837743 RepID=A0ABW1T4G1_9ACTN